MKFRKTKSARLIVFVKFVIWDFTLKRTKMTLKECWVIAGINTIMNPIPPR
jgi:hypothetical protein